MTDIKVCLVLVTSVDDMRSIALILALLLHAEAQTLGGQDQEMFAFQDDPYNIFSNTLLRVQERRAGEGEGEAQGVPVRQMEGAEPSLLRVARRDGRGVTGDGRIRILRIGDFFLPIDESQV